MDGLGISGAGSAGASGSSSDAAATSSSVKASRREGKRWSSQAASSSASTSKGKQKTSSEATTYVVSKIDAGQAVLISDQVHCIEFPSLLLPPGCRQGSIVSITCTRNVAEERARDDEFWALQDNIMSTFGEVSPIPPSLRLKNVTQTSVTLEWDKLQLATAKLLSLTIWRNGQRLAAIPNPLSNTSTKLSGLDVDANYSFHLIMRTTAGTFSSQTIKTRTLTLQDTSGIAVCFGAVEPDELLDEAKDALGKMHARWNNRIQIETTHFVCTRPARPQDRVTSPSTDQDPNPAIEYQRAVQLSIPVVHPSWILACLREKKMVPISQHYLDKTASTNASTTNLTRQSTATKAQTATRAQPAPIQLQQPPPPRNAPVETSQPQDISGPVEKSAEASEHKTGETAKPAASEAEEPAEKTSTQTEPVKEDEEAQTAATVQDAAEADEVKPTFTPAEAEAEDVESHEPAFEIKQTPLPADPEPELGDAPPAEKDDTKDGDDVKAEDDGKYQEDDDKAEKLDAHEVQTPGTGSMEDVRL